MLFVTATDTEVGKTYFSHRIIEAKLKEHSANDIAYFKPISCGKDPRKLEGKVINLSDDEYIARLHPQVKTFCSYKLQAPTSPDFAAAKENIEIKLEKILEDFNKLKQKFTYIIVEGAGGVAVPINSKQLMLDLIKALDLPCLLVIRPDLGTINHSLLSIQALHSHGITNISLETTPFDMHGNKFIPSESSRAAIESIKKFSNISNYSVIL